MKPMRAVFLLVAVMTMADLALAPHVRASDADRANGAEAAWAALRAGGNVALVRHATAPGTGDPDGFRLDDCTTQRNLSAAGRAEARAIGEAIRARGVRVDGVYSSQWCRCLETARLMGLGAVEPMPALNSFFSDPEREEPQMAGLRAWLAEARPAGAAILVTHQVVITALSGVFPQSGEIVVGTPQPGGGFSVVGRIPPPPG